MALIGIATASIAVPAYVVSNPPAIAAARPKPPVLAKLRQRVVAPTELPPVEPTNFVDLSPDEARAYNASVPFSTAPNPAARPFRFAGTEEERARALDCLAAAAIYEAGDDTVGERAVVQVVLNRLRHPAFPKTVCGVVFEGAERTTGCQFTFTCDGALTRWTPSEAGWRRAREVAKAALSGAVYKPVGYATHYHTDWVVPYWQASLDKIAAVGSHLFFRWSGWWGTPPAFNRRQSGSEQVIEKLAAISDAHRTGAALAQADAVLTESAALVTGTAIPLASDPDTIVASLDPKQPSDSYRALAIKACGDRPHCKFMGWTRLTQAALAQPLAPEQAQSLSFSYLRDRSMGFEKALWNCAEFKRTDRSQCMKAQVLMTAIPVTAPSPAPSPSATARGPEELTGVRRKSVQAPAPAPAATGAPPARAAAAPDN